MHALKTRLLESRPLHPLLGQHRHSLPQQQHVVMLGIHAQVNM